MATATRRQLLASTSQRRDAGIAFLLSKSNVVSSAGSTNVTHTLETRVVIKTNIFHFGTNISKR